jgi:hypothetical protein
LKFKTKYLNLKMSDYDNDDFDMDDMPVKESTAAKTKPKTADAK